MLQEVEGMEGIFEIKPQKILYEFKSNSNFMYCIDFETKKIIKERRIKNDYKKIIRIKRRKWNITWND